MDASGVDSKAAINKEFLTADKKNSMTFKELLTACSSGDMPCVKDTVTGSIGKVVVIKQNRNHRGVGVQFYCISFDVWYHDSDDNDKRSRYMHQLEIEPVTNCKN